MTDVLRRDGVAERGYDGYFGRTTIAATMTDFYGWDLVVHGSDIARATGQAWSISEQAAAELQRTATGGATRSTPRASAAPQSPCPMTHLQPTACSPGSVGTRVGGPLRRPEDRTGPRLDLA